MSNSQSSSKVLPDNSNDDPTPRQLAIICLQIESGGCSPAGDEADKAREVTCAWLRRSVPPDLFRELASRCDDCNTPLELIEGIMICPECLAWLRAKR